jgi:hypothetical protein
MGRSGRESSSWPDLLYYLLLVPGVFAVVFVLDPAAAAVWTTTMMAEERGGEEGRGNLGEGWGGGGGWAPLRHRPLLLILLVLLLVLRRPITHIQHTPSAHLSLFLESLDSDGSVRHKALSHGPSALPKSPPPRGPPIGPSRGASGPAEAAMGAPHFNNRHGKEKARRNRIFGGRTGCTRVRGPADVFFVRAGRGRGRGRGGGGGGGGARKRATITPHICRPHTGERANPIREPPIHHHERERRRSLKGDGEAPARGGGGGEGGAGRGGEPQPPTFPRADARRPSAPPPKVPAWYRAPRLRVRGRACG